MKDVNAELKKRKGKRWSRMVGEGPNVIGRGRIKNKKYTHTKEI